MVALDNWYVALELPFDPVPEEDQAVIDARIREKVIYWSQHANDPSKGAQYTQWRESSDRMRSDLADPVKRRQMADQALEETFGKLDQTLRRVSRQGARPITAEEIRRIAAMRGVEVDVAIRRAQAIKIEVGEEPPEDPAEYLAAFEEHYSRKPNKYAQFEGFKVHIKVTGTNDLYQFIRRVAPALLKESSPSLAKEEIARLATNVAAAEDARTLPSATLRDVGKAIRLTYHRKTNTAEKTKATVGRYCETVFGDDASRRDYDLYLDYVARRDDVDSIVEEIENLYSRRCSRALGEDYVNRLDRFIGDQATATRFFVALCRVKGFEYDVDDRDTARLKNTEVCRCGAVNDVSGGGKICTRCGRSLRQQCPKCHRESSNVHNFCPCGFDFLNVLRAGTACALARAALDEFDLVGAKANLAEARVLYADHADIPGIAAAIQKLERAIGNQLSEINRHVADLSFSRARRLLDDLRAGHPRFHNPALAAHVDEQLRRANATLLEARSQSSSADVLRLCKDAYGICHDLPGLQELVSQHTDLPLDALSVNETFARNVTVAQVNHRVVVRMDVPNDGETAIVVAYRFDAFPEGPKDPQAIKREFQVVELRQEGLLRLEPAQKRTYYVSVFLKFEASEREFFSRGVFTKLDLASRVVLTYSLAKRPFSPKLIFSLTADQPIDRIPEIVLAYTVGHAPVFQESAQHLTTIPEQGVSFPCSFTLELPRLPRNTYVKPFVQGDPVFQLKVATNSDHKIS